MNGLCMKGRCGDMTKLIVTRNVTKEECPWLDQDIRKGTIVYSYPGYTYGCIGPHGMAVSHEYDTTPFFELPRVVLEAADETPLRIHGKGAKGEM